MAEQLCAFPDIDKINALVKSVYACWATTDKKNIRLSEIINAVRQMGYSYLRSTVPVMLRNEAVIVLESIPGFKFSVEHGYLSWSFSDTDRGQIPYAIDSPEFRNIEEEIIANNPANFDELEPIIS